MGEEGLKKKRFDKTFKVQAVKMVTDEGQKASDAVALYEQYWVGESYSPISYNSNYAVNTVIYAAGGNVPGGLGWTPAFGTIPSSVFYPYTYQEN